jgi:hypothetical protein
MRGGLGTAGENLDRKQSNSEHLSVPVVSYDSLAGKCLEAMMPAHSATSPKTEPSTRGDSRTKPKSVPAPERTSEAALEEQAAKTQAPTSVQSIEPEDACLTGVSRSLQRRLLGLNASQAKPIPGASSPGIHSTGSYTEGQGVKPGEA